MRYNKPALTFSDQVKLLETRKLVVENRSVAEDFLSHVSYYRLSAYFRPFRKQGSEDFDDATFSDITNLYRFDKDLRAIFTDAIETIEVHFRTRITYHLAVHGGAFAYTHPRFFMPNFRHQDFLLQIRSLEVPSSDKFVSHFRTKYHKEIHLPIWMATELMSFGFLSHLYGGLAPAIKREIAKDFDINYFVLRSWLHTLSYVRNICAHHGRLWNRELAISPQIPNDVRRWSYLGIDNRRCYAIIVLVQDLLDRISQSQCYRDPFVLHLLNSNAMQLAGMRVPTDWSTLSPWFVGPRPR